MGINKKVISNKFRLNTTLNATRVKQMKLTNKIKSPRFEGPLNGVLYLGPRKYWNP